VTVEFVMHFSDICKRCGYFFILSILPLPLLVSSFSDVWTLFLFLLIISGGMSQWIRLDITFRPLVIEEDQRKRKHQIKSIKWVGLARNLKSENCCTTSSSSNALALAVVCLLVTCSSQQPVASSQQAHVLTCLVDNSSQQQQLHVRTALQGLLF
jgi:hypothetical protein